MADAAVTTRSNNTIEVTFTGSGDDWDCNTDCGLAKIKCRNIIWLSSADGDQLLINDGGLDGPSIVDVKAAADQTDMPIIIPFSGGQWMAPYIDITDCTFNDITATKVIFNIM